MKNCTKFISLALAAVMLLTLFTGCGDKGSDGGNNPSPGETGYVYVPTYKTLSTEGISYIQASCFTGDTVYFLADVVVGQKTAYYDETGSPVTYTSSSYSTYATGAGGSVAVVSNEADAPAQGDDGTDSNSYTYDVYETRLFALDIATGETKELAYRPAVFDSSDDGSSYISAMFNDNSGNIYIVENVSTYTYALPKDFDEETDDRWNYFTGSTNSYTLVSLTSEGEETARRNITEALGDDIYLYSERMAVAGDGTVYLTTDFGITAFSPEFEKLFNIEFDSQNGWINSIFTLSNGNVAVMLYKYGGETSSEKICEIDPEAKELTEGVTAPYSAYNIYPGDDNYYFYWANSTYFYGYDLETQESTKLFSFIGCDIDYSNMTGSPIVKENGDVMVMTSSYSYDQSSQSSSYKSELVTLTRTPADQVEQKKTLTLACVYFDYGLRNQVLKYNRNTTGYRIEVVDYSEYNTTEDYNAGLTKLNTEIIAGNVPDIIYTANLPISQYEAKGLLENLVPFIENDTELGGLEALVQPVINAMMNDKGELFQVSGTFEIVTVAGNSGLVGSDIGWTLEEFYEAYAKMPEGADIFSYHTTQQDILTYVCAMCLDDLIDWNTGECNFDSDTFKELLEFISLFPAKFDWDSYNWEEDYESEYSRISSGKQMLSTTYMYDFQYFQMYKAIFGGEMTFIGFPTATGDGNAFSVSSGLAMSSTCKDKDAAWQFIRSSLTKEYQQEYSWYYPTNKECFDEKLKAASTPEYYTDPVTGEQVERSQGSWGWDDLMVEMYALTEEEVGQIMELINTTTRIYEYSQSLFDIISDSAAAYFAGTKGLDETASLVQSRVKLYVNEQR